VATAITVTYPNDLPISSKFELYVIASCRDNASLGVLDLNGYGRNILTIRGKFISVRAQYQLRRLSSGFTALGDSDSVSLNCSRWGGNRARTTTQW
jgi:hypothetical protein